MGLPVVTKMGRGFAARVAGSLLTAMEMPELITKTEQAYEQLALDLAQSPTRLAELRQKIIAKQTTAPLFDTELYTHHLEAGYQQAYGRYLQGKDPADIIV
jgi:predicted O-linked N-acetylglucosamine transferase (SPINDLY family)